MWNKFIVKNKFIEKKKEIYCIFLFDYQSLLYFYILEKVESVLRHNFYLNFDLFDLGTFFRYTHYILHHLLTKG